MDASPITAPTGDTLPARPAIWSHFMPWSNQGGGPGGAGKGPWGSGPQASGPTPPDLEELLRRSQDKLRTVLPGGSMGGRGFALIVLGAVLLWFGSGFFRV